MKQLRPIRTMLLCWFCGGRVVPTKTGTYRCKAEGVTWDMKEDLVIYSRPEGEVLTQVRTPRDSVTGEFIRVGAGA